MRLTPGQRLGPFEIVGILGAGGMGEVYRARDLALHRDVAIKVLPDLVASDPEKLTRFTREARTLAALNHPNIAHIHGLEETTGVRALVMELVDGEDLSDVIARGALPPTDAVAIARQIADALEARARTGHRPSRSEARQYQGPRGRDREGPGLRTRQGPRAGGGGARNLAETRRRSPPARPNRA